MYGKKIIIFNSDWTKLKMGLTHVDVFTREGEEILELKLFLFNK